MEWEAVERRSENDRLSAALAKLIDRNWSQDQKLDQALDRVRDMESRVGATEALLKESHINQTALDVEVIGLQQRVAELESETLGTRGDLPSGQMLSFCWFCVKLAQPLPTRQMLGKF